MPQQSFKTQLQIALEQTCVRVEHLKWQNRSTAKPNELFPAPSTFKCLSTVYSQTTKFTSVTLILALNLFIFVGHYTFQDFKQLIIERLLLNEHLRKRLDLSKFPAQLHHFKLDDAYNWLVEYNVYLHQTLTILQNNSTLLEGLPDVSLYGEKDSLSKWLIQIQKDSQEVQKLKDDIEGDQKTEKQIQKRREVNQRKKKRQKANDWDRVKEEEIIIKRQSDQMLKRESSEQGCRNSVGGDEMEVNKSSPLKRTYQQYLRTKE